MKKAILLIPSVILILFLLITSINDETPRPNVVLIIVDMLRADKLGAYGFPADISPEIDRMAEKGIRFIDVTAQCSWTRPSTASFTTGKYPRSIGMYMDMESNDILNSRYTNIAEVMKENGYKTYGITANPTINSIFNFGYGFDRYIDSNYIWWWMDAEKNQINLPQKRQKSYENGEAFIPLNNAVDIFQKVIEYAEAENSIPSYVQINVMEVHEYWKLLRPEFKNSFKTVKDIRERGYLASIKQVSHDIGEFVNKLTGLPGWDNTLFIIISDHGEGLNDHPSVPRSRSHGRLLYESQVKVPMIWYYPYDQDSGIIDHLAHIIKKAPYRLKHKQISERVRLMDLMPTLLQYLDMPLPSDIDGVSLLSLIKGGISPALPEKFVSETYFRGSDKIAVYSDKWKYIENHDGHKGVNPKELQPAGITENGRRTDQAGKRPEMVRTMKKFLTSWENEHPMVEPTNNKSTPSEEVLKQLKSLGYIN